MASTITHSALFAAGLLIGAGAVAYTSRHQHHSSCENKSAHQQQQSNQQIPLNPTGNLVHQNQHFFSNPAFTPINSPSSNKSSLSDILKFGHPGPISDLFARQAYALGYDRRMRNPAWTAEHLTYSNLRPPVGEGDGSPDRSHSSFHEDSALPPQFRSKLSDYFRSGYDRGHMVPAADAKRSQAAMDETFILSNIAPQVGEGFNRDYWAHLENFVRQLTNSFQDVYVFTLPLYLPKPDPITGKQVVTYEVIGNPPNVAVPTHFAKVIYGVGGKPDPKSRGALGSFVLPNAAIPNTTPLTSFQVPVQSIERDAGLVLFPDSIKQNPTSLCSTIKCDLVIRNFDNFNKQVKSS